MIFHLGGLESVSDPAAFSQKLDRIAGRGANTLKRLILKAVYLKLGLSIDDTYGSNFEESLRRARELLAEKENRP